MQLPKYRAQHQSVPAVELSLRPLQVAIRTTDPQQQPKPPFPIHVEDDVTTEVDPNDLHVMQDEGGTSSPIVLPEPKQ
jgi:hypothetical protein